MISLSTCLENKEHIDFINIVEHYIICMHELSVLLNHTLGYKVRCHVNLILFSLNG